MSKKALLFINGHLNTGGVEKSLLDILTHLDYEKYEVDLLLTEKLGDYAPQLPPQVKVLLRSIEGTYGPLGTVLLQGFRRRDWFTVKMRLVFLLMRLFGSRCICLAKHLLTGGKEYDCVVGFRRGLCTEIAAYAVNAKRRITWWHHGSVNVDPKAYLEQVKPFPQVVAVSEGCRTMLQEAMPSLADRLVTIHNILNPDTIRARAAAFQPYRDDGLIHIVSVGGLAPEKHFDNAIYAAKRLKELDVPFRWHLVGDGVLREELRKKAAELEVTDRFHFEGNQVNPYPYIKNADLFVHPSYVESFGIVVLEAMALGIPCVVTRSLGPEEFIEDGINGLLTDQSPEALTDGVLRILEDRALYDSIRANSRCPEQYLPENVMKRIEELFFAGENAAEQKR